MLQKVLPHAEYHDYVKFTENIRDEETEPERNMAFSVTWPIECNWY